MRTTPAPEAHLVPLANALGALAGQLGRKDAAAVAAYVIEQLSRAPAGAASHSVAVTLQVLTARLDVPELVELVKAPAAVGPAEQIVLRQLGRRAGRTFESVWDVVDWLPEPGSNRRASSESCRAGSRALTVRSSSTGERWRGGAFLVLRVGLQGPAVVVDGLGVAAVFGGHR
jgi:hypothetical protein